jgi:hypothetical protein
VEISTVAVISICALSNCIVAVGICPGGRNKEDTTSSVGEQEEFPKEGKEESLKEIARNFWLHITEI